MPGPAELASAAAILREATQDQSYRNTPVGVFVGRYMRWLSNEWGATPATVKAYEQILARMSLALADRELIEVLTDDLRDVIYLWSDGSPATRAKVTSIIRAFWSWCEEQGHIAISPAARIRRPRLEKKVARALSPDAKQPLLEAAKDPRDRLALYCLLGLGLRRNELRMLRVQDFAKDGSRVRVYGKGRKERVLPMRGPIVSEFLLYLTTDLPHAGRTPRAADYLLYPVESRIHGRTRAGVDNRVRTGHPERPLSLNGITKWWYRLAQEAELVAPGVTSGFNMHAARHLFAMEMRRAAGIDAASMALGHANLNTTLGIYGHQDDSDLERAFDALEDWQRD